MPTSSNLDELTQKLNAVKRDIFRLTRKLRVRPYFYPAYFLLILPLFLPWNFQFEGPLISLPERIVVDDQIVMAILDFSPRVVANNDSFPNDLTAQTILVRDRNTGQVLFAKNEHELRSIASLTKIALALVTIQNCDLSQSVTVSDVMQDGSLMGLNNGERVTVHDLLTGLLVNSGNDAAFQIGQSCFGSSDQTVKDMNELIETLQLKNTHFQDVAGLSLENHYSSAYDISALAEILLRDQILSEIVRTKELELVSLDNNRWYQLKNTNELLFSNNQVYGVKTGYTEEAGECLILAYRNSQSDYLITILGSEARFSEGERIIEWLNGF